MKMWATNTHPISILDRFVYFSTDEVFGPAPAGVIYAEYDRYNSGNPYAAAKVRVYHTLLIRP